MKVNPASHAAAEAVIDADVPCIGCGYNLRMQPRAGRCPECGESILRTLTFPHLSRSAPRWLVSLLDSVTVLLVSFGLALLSLFTHNDRDDLWSISVITAAWGTAWFAVWLLTRPEPGVRDFDATAWAWSLRVLVTIAYVAAFIAPPIHFFAGPWGSLVLLLMLACLAPATCLYYNRLRRAAGRLPNKRLAFQAGALQVLLPVATLLPISRMVMGGRGPGSATAFLLHLPLVGVGSVGDAWLFLQIVRGRLGLLDWVPMSTAPSLVAVFLSVVVLVQFRFAFAAAVREAGGR